jgi:deoxyribodipyrimidine photo-lyase
VLFPPTLEEARARIAAVDPAAYARTRNSLDGAVTRLSPYITHGVVSLPEVLAGVAARHPLDAQHRFVLELGWREYFHSTWQHRGKDILASLHEGLLPDDAYTRELPADVRQARTEVPVIDQAVRTLYATGYLHNHARLWLASYLVHLRKVHWRTGADWLVGHLLDGDLASNHLSWQWVAGTASRKPYLFNAENVTRHAGAAWHSPGTVVDRSYEALDEIARGGRPVPGQPAGDGVEEPTLSARPTWGTAPEPAAVAGRDVWLVHPWALGLPPPDLPAGTVCLGWWPLDHHARWPWAAQRWAFVGASMSAVAPMQWQADRAALAAALAGARSVQTQADGHVRDLLPAGVVQRPAPRLFAPVDVACRSFSAWWRRTAAEVRQLADLPGLAAWQAQQSA